MRLTLIAKEMPGIGYVPVSVLEDHIYGDRGAGTCSCGEIRTSVLIAGYEFEFHGVPTEALYQGI